MSPETGGARRRNTEIMAKDVFKAGVSRLRTPAGNVREWAWRGAWLPVSLRASCVPFFSHAR